MDKNYEIASNPWESMDIHTKEAKELIQQGRLREDDPRALIFVEGEKE